MPWQRVCELNTPNASQRANKTLTISCTDVAVNPPTSWLQNENPERPNESPPRNSVAMTWSVLSAAPPHCTGYLWLPAQALRAQMILSPEIIMVTSVLVFLLCFGFFF